MSLVFCHTDRIKDHCIGRRIYLLFVWARLKISASSITHAERIDKIVIVLLERDFLCVCVSDELLLTVSIEYTQATHIDTGVNTDFLIF